MTFVSVVDVIESLFGKGYFDEITAALPGFIMLAERYYKKTGEDVPVVPAYYYRKGSKVIIGKSLYVQDMVKEGLSTEQIAERFKDEIPSTKGVL